MKKQFLILFAFISVLALSQVPQRFNKVVVTGDITSPKFIKTGSNADSVLLGNGSARSVNSLKTDTVNLSNRINAKATGNGTANGTNTGDETLTSIKTKLGAATAVSDGYLKYQDWNLFNSKEPAITKNTAFNKTFGTTTGTVLEGRTFGTAANSAVGDFQPAITGLATNYIPKWNGSNFVSSGIYEDLLGVKIGTTTNEGTEKNGILVKTSSPLTPSDALRAINAISNYSGTFASTAIQSQAHMSGSNNHDHTYGLQSWVFGDGTGTINTTAGVMSSMTNNGNTINTHYGFLCNSPTINSGAINNSYGFYTSGAIPSYLHKLILGSTQPASSGTTFFLDISAPFSSSIYGLGTTMAKIFSNSTAAIGEGGVLNLGGKATNAETEYSYAFLKGSPQSSSTYRGSFEIFTTSGGGDGEVDSGNYRRYFADGEKHIFFGKNESIAAQINKNGALLVNTSMDNGVDKIQVNGSVSASSFSGSGSNLTGIQLPITLTTNGTSGAATFSGNVLNVPNYAASGGVNQTQTTVNGSTGGNMVCSMPFQTGSYKKVLIALNGLNGSATYTFPSSFSRIPDAVGRGSSGLGIAALSTTSITITSTGSTGWCIIEGY